MTQDSAKPIYSISSAARLLGISVHTLRMYEREGLIIPFKERNKNRLYSDRDIERCECIRAAINDKKFTIPAIKSLFSMTPCWDIIKCSIKDRKNCPAYIKSYMPCWTYQHMENKCSRLDCRNCTVYNDYSECDKIKSGIKNITVNK